MRYIVDMDELKNFRAVGLFDLLSAPVTPIGAFDAEQFKKDVRPLFDKGSRFIAVDLTGLDFLYSDACSAFNMIRQELSAKEGFFAILSDNDTVLDCLKKSGLDKSLLVFRKEADMMAFSMKENSGQREGEVEKETAPAARSENRISVESADPVRRRVTGRFTKSFNAIRKDSTPLKSGLESPFQEKKNPGRIGVRIVLFLLLAAAVVALIALR